MSRPKRTLYSEPKTLAVGGVITLHVLELIYAGEKFMRLVKRMREAELFFESLPGGTEKMMAFETLEHLKGSVDLILGVSALLKAERGLS